MGFFKILVFSLFIRHISSSLNIIRIGGILPNDSSLKTAFMLASRELSVYTMRQYNTTLQYTIFESNQHFHTAVSMASQLAQIPVLGIVGEQSNMITKAIAQTCTDFNVLQVAYGANAAEFSINSDYPTFSRIYPSNGYEAFILADLVANTFGWGRVVLLPSTNQYGTIATKIFTYYANQMGIDIIDTIFLPPITGITNETQNNLIVQIQNVEQLEARIWVILSDDISAIKNFFFVAQRILSINTYFLGGSAITTPDLWQNTGLSFDFMDTILAGYIGIKNADADWMQTPSGQELLYRMKTSYRFVNPLSAYVYDSVYVLVNGIINYSFSHNQNIVPKTISGSFFNNFLIKTTNFNGTTGLIELSAGATYYNDYGIGDREVGLCFEVLNYQNENNTQQGMRLQRVGTYISQYGFDETYTIVWGTPENTIPLDRPEPLVEKMPRPLQNFVIFLSVVTFLGNTAVLITVVYYRKSRLLHLCTFKTPSFTCAYKYAFCFLVLFDGFLTNFFVLS